MKKISLKLKKRDILFFLFTISLLISVTIQLPEGIYIFFITKTFAGHEFVKFKFLFLKEIREIFIILTLLFFLANYFSKLPKKIIIFMSFYLSYILLLSTLTIIRGYPLIVIIAEFKVVYYTLFVIMAYYFADKREFTFFKNVYKLLFILVIIEIFLGVMEIFFSAPVEGKTLFGSRPFGTFVRPYLYGIFLVSCMLYFVVYEKLFKIYCNKILILLIFAMLITTGNRGVILAGIILVVFYLITSFKSELYLKVCKTIVIFLIAIISLFFINNPKITGRATSFTNDFRIVLFFKELVPKLSENFLNLFFGYGFGITSTTLYTLLHGKKLQGMLTLVDSNYIHILGSFGIFGLLLILFLLFYLYLKFFNKTIPMFIISYFLIISIPYPLVEMIPGNIIFYLTLGLALGIKNKLSHNKLYHSTRKI